MNSYQKIKYQEINLKEIKDLYNENYKRLMKEIEDTKRWKDGNILHVYGL
jgi:hypothetical protein